MPLPSVASGTARSTGTAARRHGGDLATVQLRHAEARRRDARATTSTGVDDEHADRRHERWQRRDDAARPRQRVTARGLPGQNTKPIGVGAERAPRPPRRRGA